MKPIKVSETELTELLTSSHDFSRLPEDAVSLLAQHLKTVSVESGETVINENETGDCLFFVIRGRLRVSRRNEQQQLMLYNEILPGECVGETSMILQQPRTSDVTASRNSVLGMLTEQDYQTLLQSNPVAFNKAFAFAVYRYLRHIRQTLNFRRAQTIVVIGLHPDSPATSFCRQLEQAFSSKWQTRRLERDAYTPGTDDFDTHFDQWEADNDILLLECDGASSALENTVKQADQIIFVTQSDSDKALSQIEQRLVSVSGMDMVRKHLAVIYSDEATHSQPRSDWLQSRDIERIYPVRLSQMDDFHRLRRYLTNQTIGVVLGGGGARGFAHIGVLKAMREHDIPIDVLGGNSMGALIGALYAHGMSLEEIPEVIQRFSSAGLTLNLPLVSLMSNKRFEKALQSVFRDRNMDELWLPFFTAACNLTQGCTQTLDSGPVWQAVLASNSPAGILPPVIERGELLVDGAILDNVPVMAMRGKLGTALERRRGYGTIIAVDVDVKEGLSVAPETKKLSPMDTLRSRFSRNKTNLPGLASILMQSSHIGSLAQRQRTKAMADYYLEPPVTHFPLLGYDNAEAIIHTAYQHACDQISHWEIPS